MDLVYFHIHEWGYILLVLFLHSAKPSPSLTCVDFGTVFAGDLVHYPWTLLGCPFLLGVYQYSLDGLVLSHDGHNLVMVEHSTKYLQQTLDLWDGDQNSCPHLFDDIYIYCFSWLLQRQAWYGKVGPTPQSGNRAVTNMQKSSPSCSFLTCHLVSADSTEDEDSSLQN